MQARRWSSLALGGLLALGSAASAPVASAAPPDAASASGHLQSATRHTRTLPIAPRLQWNANFGYCGETSLISAGMDVGQYTSQWTARSLASPGVPQTDEESQLLLGVNDVTAAERMRLAAVAYDSQAQRSTAAYLTWVKSMVLRGSPVIIGVYMNMSDDPASAPGSDEYDHIVPVLGVGSDAPLRLSDRRYRPRDVIVFSDNSGDVTSSVYRSGFGTFQRTRAQANAPSAPDYSLRNRPENYAIAVTGVLDPQHVTIPVRLTSSTDGEGQQDGVMLTAAPPPTPIDLTATVTIPDPSRAYTVYLYDDFAKVPTQDFNAAAASAIQSWKIPPGTSGQWSTTISALSDQTRVFRAVPTTAP